MNNTTMQFCYQCGEKLRGTTLNKCPSCGAMLRTRRSIARKKRLRRKRIKKILRICIPVLIAIIIIVVVGFFIGKNTSIGGVNFEKVYNKIGGSNSENCCKLASDGSYIRIDTNPRNYENTMGDLANMANVHWIQKVNDALGLPEYLYQDMASTRAIDGRITETFGKITISWSYHPEQGLEAIYKKAD